ncbi:uncharacterized protein LOC114790301 isoform X2 [Denticeps clupeoides]|uniref:uncharacterized protein LOC114790301 isoform X2 n=1 Tax=Denticeps clupeoides TaxID=299321 RepID=UPI0010A39E8C|nr:uncharacterized protein LOC114790301 isoform X2 [Denticeps clupeoides]
MDGTLAASPEKRLRGHLNILSKYMPPWLLEHMSNYLLDTRTITKHELQVIHSQTLDSQKVTQLVQIVLRKGQGASHRFYKCLRECSPIFYSMLTGPSGLTAETISQLEELSVSERQHTTPSYVIQISNSTVSNCIFGSNNDQHVVTENKPRHAEDSQLCEPGVGSENGLIVDKLLETAASEGSRRIQVDYSHVEHVIIGNNNIMDVEVIQDEDWQEEEESEETC